MIWIDMVWIDMARPGNYLQQPGNSLVWQDALLRFTLSTSNF